MKESLTPLKSETDGIFATAEPVDIKVGGEFVGAVWLVSQAPAEETWEVVPGTVSDRPNQFRLDAVDIGIVYRFAGNIKSGEAVCYTAAGVVL